MGFMKTAVVVALLAAGCIFLQRWIKPRPPKEVHGFCTPKFAAVKDAFRANLESGDEEGGAFAAYHEGELVCELWGGWADDELQYPWQRNTLNMLYSATKAFSSICLMILADRGLLDYNAPVARYWPEFAQNGKENITLRTLVSHTAGLAAIDEDYSYKFVEDDPDRLSRILAAQKPNWEPGTKSGYHALSFGFYLNELVKRVDPQHRTMQQFFIQEIAQRFDLDLHMGLPLSENYRLARLSPIDPAAPHLLVYELLTNSDARNMLYNLYVSKDPTLHRAFFNPNDHEKDGEFFTQWPEYQAISDGSSHGYGTVQALAKLYGILANGGSHQDKQLLSEQGVNLLRQSVWSGHDVLLGIDVNWGHGVSLMEPEKDVWMFGCKGHGGQMSFGIPEKKLGWGYVTNHMSFIVADNLPRYKRVSDALLKAVQ